AQPTKHATASAGINNLRTQTSDQGGREGGSPAGPPAGRDGISLTDNARKAIEFPGLEVVLADRMEDVERLDRLLQGNDLMAHVARDAEDVARPERLFLAADNENGPALEDDADLLVRMAMLFHHGVRLEGGEREHHL